MASGDGHSCIPTDFTCSELKNTCSGYFNVAIRYYCSTSKDEISPSWFTFIQYNLIILAAIVFSVVGLSLIVSNYMFPNLHQITTRFKIHDKFLGFIIIPFINSFPDILNYYNSIKSNSIDLVLGQLIGSNLILLSLILGLISVLKPTNIRSHMIVLIDVLWVFLILSVFNVILKDGKITLLESLVMAVVYIFHLIYLFGINKEVELDLINIDSNANDTRLDIEHNSSSPPNTEYSPNKTPYSNNFSASSSSADLGVNLQPENSYQEAEPIDIDHQLEDIEEEMINNDPFILQFIHLLVHSLNFLLKVVLPVDIENKWVHLYYYGISCLFVWQKFPSFNLVIVLGISFVLVAIATKRAAIPFFINMVGIINSILLMSDISLLILKLLKNYGVILKISDYLLGFLIFSVANSINDLITNLTLSITVNPFIGINSCLGTPLLLILVGIGYNTLLQNKVLHFNLQLDLMVTSVALMSLMGLLLILIPLNNWNFDKRMGIGLLGFWLIISLANCILER